MHPNTFFRTLFSPSKRDEVFVIMSFAKEFEERWQHIIEPLIREDLHLKPNCVDYNRSGETVIHDMMDGIAHSRLVLTEITSSQMTDAVGHILPQRNGNVMWELGVAHMMRMPNEVIIIRSDMDRTIFDLTQYRAFDYDPEDFAASRSMLKTLMEDRLKAIDQTKSYHVKECAQSLDLQSWMILLQACGTGKVRPLAVKTIGDALIGVRIIPAISRLLEMGVLSTAFTQVTVEILQSSIEESAENMLEYTIIPFGIAVVKHIGEKMGLDSPELQSKLEKPNAEMTHQLQFP
jgi:hypothetical protein